MAAAFGRGAFGRRRGTNRRILAAAQKIDPTEKAGYVINDNEGLRYLEIDYNQVSDK